MLQDGFPKYRFGAVREALPFPLTDMDYITRKCGCQPIFRRPRIDKKPANSYPVRVRGEQTVAGLRA